MQKIYKVIISLILAALFINVFPYNVVFAEDPSPTYVIADSCTNFAEYKIGSTQYYVHVYASSDKIRFTGSWTQGNYMRIYSGVPNSLMNGVTPYINVVADTNVACTLNSASTQMSSSNVTDVNSNTIQFRYNLTSVGSRNITDVHFLYVESPSLAGAQDYYDYLFGQYAVPYPDSVSYGELRIGFSTDIAYSGGNQDAWRLNKDTIYFDRYDTLGNDLFGNLIELQAIPFSVYDQSKQNLLSKTVNDYVFDTVKVGHLGYWSPGQDYIDFTWEYITNRFAPTWWSTYGDNYSLVGWFLNEKWYRVGWAYRARLVDEDNNELIPWQWVYNGTSIDTQDSVNIINNNGLTPELVNSINNINNYNNTTNNNTYNNQTINYYSSDQESDGSWIETLLESILGTIADLVGKILDFFKSILDGLLDLILGLFGDVDPAGSFFNWFSDLFNGIGDIDLTLPQFNLPNEDLTGFNRLVQETLNIFSSNNIAFLIFIPLIILIIRAVF